MADLERHLPPVQRVSAPCCSSRVVHCSSKWERALPLLGGPAVHRRRLQGSVATWPTVAGCAVGLSRHSFTTAEVEGRHTAGVSSLHGRHRQRLHLFCPVWHCDSQASMTAGGLPSYVCGIRPTVHAAQSRLSGHFPCSVPTSKTSPRACLPCVRPCIPCARWDSPNGS